MIRALEQSRIDTNRRNRQLNELVASLEKLTLSLSPSLTSNRLLPLLKAPSRALFSSSQSTIRALVRLPARPASSSRPSRSPLLRNHTEIPLKLYYYDSDSSSDSSPSHYQTVPDSPIVESPTEQDLYPVCESCLDSLLESSEGFGEPEQLLDNSGSKEKEVEYSGEEDAYD